MYSRSKSEPQKNAFHQYLLLFQNEAITQNNAKTRTCSDRNGNEIRQSEDRVCTSEESAGGGEGPGFSDRREMRTGSGISSHDGTFRVVFRLGRFNLESDSRSFCKSFIDSAISHC